MMLTRLIIYHQDLALINNDPIRSVHLAVHINYIRLHQHFG